jgi:hypothetical protein
VEINLNNPEVQEQWIVTWGYKNDGDYRVEFVSRKKAEEFYGAVSTLNLTHVTLYVERSYQSIHKVEDTDSELNINHDASSISNGNQAVDLNRRGIEVRDNKGNVTTLEKGTVISNNLKWHETEKAIVEQKVRDIEKQINYLQDQLDIVRALS